MDEIGSGPYDDRPRDPDWAAPTGPPVGGSVIWGFGGDESGAKAPAGQGPVAAPQPAAPQPAAPQPAAAAPAPLALGSGRGSGRGGWLRAAALVGAGVLVGAVGVGALHGGASAGAADTAAAGPVATSAAPGVGVPPDGSGGASGTPRGGLTGETRVLGTVAAVGASSITVTATDGGTATYAVSADTEIVRNGASAELSDLAVGDRVLVHVLPGQGTATAERILAGALPAGPGGLGRGLPGTGTGGTGGSSGDGQAPDQTVPDQTVPGTAGATTVTFT